MCARGQDSVLFGAVPPGSVWWEHGCATVVAGNRCVTENKSREEVSKTLRDLPTKGFYEEAGMARCLDVNKFGLFPGQPGVIFSAVQGKVTQYPVRSSFQVPQERKWRALSNYSPRRKKI